MHETPSTWSVLGFRLRCRHEVVYPEGPADRLADKLPGELPERSLVLFQRCERSLCIVICINAQEDGCVIGPAFFAWRTAQILEAEFTSFVRVARAIQGASQDGGYS